MKKVFFWLLAYVSALSAESIWDYHPIHVGGNAIFLGNADVKRRHGGDYDGKVLFNRQTAYAYVLVPATKSNIFIPRVEYASFELDWNHNTRFNEKRFQYIQYALTFFTTAIEKWRWIMRADYNMDLNHLSRPGSYALFSALLWGTHDLNDRWKYHVGAFGYTGYDGQQVYPIIGFDYKPNNTWLFQAVFPINYMIQYSFTERWRIALKGRPLKERFRVGKNNPDPRGIFSYSSFGTELNLSYEKFLHLDFEIYAGYNWGGNMYFKDRNGNNPLYTSVESSPYGGASINWGF